MPTSPSLDTESARMLAIPFICWSLTFPDMAAAYKPHFLHLSLSVHPVKFLVVVCGQNVQEGQHFVGNMNTFLLTRIY